MTEATQYLVEPGRPDESVTNGFTNPLDLFNYISPSAWVNDVIEKTTGVDIFGWVTDFFTGEWDALWKFGDAMANLAQVHAADRYRHPIRRAGGRQDVGRQRR